MTVYQSQKTCRFKRQDSPYVDMQINSKFGPTEGNDGQKNQKKSNFVIVMIYVLDFC